MRALLLKDYYMMRRILRLYLAVALLTQAVSVTGILVLALYPVMLPGFAFAYDDRSRWGELAAMMPWSDWQIVASRYALGGICIAGFSALCLTVRVLIRTFFPLYAAARGLVTDIPSVLVLLSASLLFLDLSLPVCFRFDAEKSQAVRLLLVLLLAVGLGAGYGILGKASWQTGERAFVWAYGNGWILPAASVPLTAVSMPLSVRAYRARRN